MTSSADRFANMHLVAPVTHHPVRVAGADALAALNAAIEAGGVTDRSGRPVDGPLEGALIADLDRLVFPIRDGIPVMLRSDAIPFQADWESALGSPEA